MKQARRATRLRAFTPSSAACRQRGAEASRVPATRSRKTGACDRAIAYRARMRPRTTALFPSALLLTALLLPTLPASGATECQAARQACLAATNLVGAACRAECKRRGDRDCARACETARESDQARCRAQDDGCAAACSDVDPAACRSEIRACRRDARREHRSCQSACEALDPPSRPSCRDRCRRERASAENGCGFLAVGIEPGAPALPDLPTGQPADLSLLEPEERARIEAADARAEALHTRPLRLHVGTPGTPVRVTQVKHGFPFGFPVDVRRFANADDREWYARTMSAHFNLVVVENTLKWAGVEPAEGVRHHADADADVAFGTDLGLPVKGHALMWGIEPPFSSSGMPAWARTRFAALTLPPADKAALRDILRRHVFDLVERYRGRIGIWDVTNETLQAFGRWFIKRLGPGIVDDLFLWAHEADPDVQLVFNEWIVEVFTGLQHPTAAEVRDRVLALRAAGVPIHAVGQQAHFVPSLAFAGVPVDLTTRTRIDDYEIALDTLAETGLPIHITETNFIAPEDPEERAAQAEGLLRLWWGHPSVEQIVFWGPWNEVAGRDEFDVGFWDDDRNLTRHGEAVLSLLNDRWRTRAGAVTDASGAVELTATHGDYVAEWVEAGVPVHARFRVEPGPGRVNVAVTR
ncbi:MAG: hypothetical protein FJ144_26610 [Deltaproteobacteria bacterium]|nr:hypothetical protein [Deltaproteobacteria bacterium]